MVGLSSEEDRGEGDKPEHGIFDTWKVTKFLQERLTILAFSGERERSAATDASGRLQRRVSRQRSHPG